MSARDADPTADPTGDPTGDVSSGGQRTRGPVGSASDVPTGAGLAPRAGEHPDATPPDEVLVRRTLSGDERAFGRLVERYQALLMLVAYRRSGRGADCEDIVQEAFVRAFRALATLERPERFRSWLCQIASNVALDRVRRRSPVVSFDQDSGLMRALPPGPADRASARAEVEEERDRLIAAIERLPQTYQVPVVLRHVEGLSYREIAKRLGVREEALRKRIHRANAMLQKELSGRVRGPRKEREGG